MTRNPDVTRIEGVRRRAHELLDPTADEGLARSVNLFVMGLIAVNVAAVILGTVDSIQAMYGEAFAVLEMFSVGVFTIEYLARLWSQVEELDGWNPVIDRIRIAMRPMLVVDLVAILPFYLALIGVGIDLRFLRALRLIRLLRLLKLVRYSDTMRAFGRAFRRKRDQLIVATSANAIILVVASSLMFLVERDAQPEAFGSIPETMWWGIVTLTTVGYGNVAPVTPFGRALGALVAVLGIGLFALPASIMASGFIEESDYETGFCPDCGHELDWERDVGNGRATYNEGDWVRLDMSIDSQLPDYDLHGKHGHIRDCDPRADRYEIAVPGRDDPIEAEWRDLRSPYRALAEMPSD